MLQRPRSNKLQEFNVLILWNHEILEMWANIQNLSNQKYARKLDKSGHTEF